VFVESSAFSDERDHVGTLGHRWGTMFSNRSDRKKECVT
jgi:hypothetical protein